jgi:hypothetical protein
MTEFCCNRSVKFEITRYDFNILIYQNISGQLWTTIVDHVCYVYQDFVCAEIVVVYQQHLLLFSIAISLTCTCTSQYSSLSLIWPLQPKATSLTNVSSNPARGEVYLIQHYVIKFVSDL